MEDLLGGFLDPSAPNLAAEYSRYIDGDLLGKLIARNLLLNRLGYDRHTVFTPLGRYGDAKVKYPSPGTVAHDPGDGHVFSGKRKITFEVKCARINIANRSLGGTSENWAFVNLCHSPGKVQKTYDVLIAVGVSTLGLEDDRYWKHLLALHERLRAQGHASKIDALPHQPEFLSLCSFFFIPRLKLKTNYFRVHVDGIDRSPYAAFRAWGYDETGCRQRWAAAISESAEV